MARLAVVEGGTGGVGCCSSEGFDVEGDHGACRALCGVVTLGSFLEPWRLGSPVGEVQGDLLPPASPEAGEFWADAAEVPPVFS